MYASMNIASTNIQEKLCQDLQDKSARVAVLGMGYVGLPFAVVFAEAGYHVIGIDPDARKVDSVNRGESYVMDVPQDQLARLVKSGYLSATTDYSILKDIQAVSICVPTPLSKAGDPDLSFIVSATDSMAEYMHPGIVIVLESTTYPGTTRDLILPKLANDQLEVGKDFFLAFSPERVDPGRTDWTTKNTPKVIGGVTPACLEVSKTWYSQALETVVPVSSAEVAEMAKLLENTFRMINIGLVNELAIICSRLGVDVWDVIDAAATKPFGFMKFTPGPGLGGHCIPIDPLYLSWKMRSLNYTARFIDLASEINMTMPYFVVSKVQDAMNERGMPVKGRRILILGAAYKPDVDDLRESKALDVISLLQRKGAIVEYHDPYIPHIKHEEWLLHSVENLTDALKTADCAVIITNHSVYDYHQIIETAQLIVDTRNAIGEMGRGNSKVVRL
jgi:UDP-N-acetyl-D-glucosamine dehydrogenase